MPTHLPVSVTVTVPARLHLGFLDLNGGLGRRFGSIGLAIGGLRTRIAIEARVAHACRRSRARARASAISTPCGARSASATARIGSQSDEAFRRMSGSAPVRSSRSPSPPRLRTLHGLPLDTPRDAVRLGRGGRSGVGIGLFDDGGFVVDGGHGSTDAAPPIVSRIAFPPQWRVLVVLDPARQGVHGPDESAAFAALPIFSGSDAGAPVPAGAHAGPAGARRADLAGLRRGDQGDAGGARRLLCTGAGRQPFREPGGRRVSRTARPRRRPRHRAKLMGADRVCLRGRRSKRRNASPPERATTPGAGAWTSAFARRSITGRTLRMRMPSRPSKNKRSQQTLGKRPWPTRTSCTCSPRSST